jgi:Lysophospholipase L1 and related esterases
LGTSESRALPVLERVALAAAVCHRKLSGNLRKAVTIGFSLALFSLLGLGLTLPGLVHAAASPHTILVLGDSLSAGYGVKVDATWVALLEQRLAKQGYGYRVVNASISGETTGGARSRLPRALELHKPDVVVIELGGNDGLRGLPLKQVRGNFEYLIETSQAAQAKVVLVGMRMPPNYGAEYANSFHALYGELAKKYDVPLVDFFLDGVALDDTLMQADGIHPNATAQPKLLDNLWPALSKVLKK